AECRAGRSRAPSRARARPPAWPRARARRARGERAPRARRRAQRFPPPEAERRSGRPPTAAARPFRADPRRLRIEIPPLRARRDDLPLLLEELNQRIARKAGRSPLVFTPAALDTLAAHDFPGNVRELENELQRLYAVLGPDEREVPPERLSRRIRESDPMAQGRYGDALRAFKIQLLERALQDCGGNQAAAARRLGV